MKQINSLKVIGDSLLMIFATFIFDFRYGLELFLAKPIVEYLLYDSYHFFLIVVCLMLISIGLLRLISILENQMSQHSKYIYIPFLKVIFRYKANWYFISFTTVVMLVIFSKVV